MTQPVRTRIVCSGAWLLSPCKYEGRLVACKKKFRAVVFHEGHELVAAVVIGIIVVNQRRWDKALI